MDILNVWKTKLKSFYARETILSVDETAFGRNTATCVYGLPFLFLFYQLSNFRLDLPELFLLFFLSKAAAELFQVFPSTRDVHLVIHSQRRHALLLVAEIFRSKSI